MKLRMTIATGLAAAALSALSGCGTNGAGSTPDPTPGDGTTITAAPTTEPAGSTDLTGDWNAPEANWIVHFNADGTFVEDFEGVTDFRVGTYKVDGDTVSLIGDDGNTDKGMITGETLVFKLGTLTRK